MSSVQSMDDTTGILGARPKKSKNRRRIDSESTDLEVTVEGERS